MVWLSVTMYITTLGGPHTAMIGLPSHNPDTIASSEDAQRPILVEIPWRSKQQDSIQRVRRASFFLVLWSQIRSTTHWIPAWTILRDFTWKTPIYQSMMGNKPCLLKFFKQPFRNELRQLFSILCLYKSQVPISKKIHLAGLRWALFDTSYFESLQNPKERVHCCELRAFRSIFQTHALVGDVGSE